MTHRTLPKQHQRGAVAILAGLAVTVLFGFLALVVDLGNLYVNKTELQNAADAAALAGAKELLGTAAGIDSAVQSAIATAALNKSGMGKTAVAISANEIRFGASPDLGGTWSTVADAKASPADKFFIKVDTSGIAQGTLNTVFIRILSPSTTTTSTFGLAVAGRGRCNAVPLFTCTKSGTAPNYGYVPGRQYRFTDTSGSTIGPGNVGYFDPVPPGAPSLNNGANAMRNLIASGKTYCLASGKTYSSLTQAAFGTMADAFNTRFGDYKGGLNSTDDHPDTNVAEYPYNANGSGVPKAWMAANPTVQSEDDGGTNAVHWSAVKPAAGDTPAIKAAGYPASGTPYSQTSGAFYSQVKTADQPYAESGRRILTLGFASNCGSINGAGQPVQMVGFGRFFLPVRADGTGSPKKFYVEFIEGLTATPADYNSIKLYQ